MYRVYTLYMCACVHVYRCTGVRNVVQVCVTVYRCKGIQVYSLYTGTQMYRFTYENVWRCLIGPGVQMYRCASVLYSLYMCTGLVISNINLIPKVLMRQS